MTILRWLEGLRTPWLDSLMSAVTELGDETVFMVAGLVILWCVNKRWGFRFLLTGLTGSVVNQLLKAIFLIPRPWVLDPSFTIVESARAGATGYSFPSGHTQSAATLFGTLAMWSRRRWSTLLCVAMVLLVGFSRMYLGVHTPADVREPWRVCHQGLDTNGFPIHGQGDGLELAAVLIFSGEKRNQVIERKDAQLVKRLRLFLSYALDITNVGM